ncbi:hypothetical protein EVAR_55687_1 [Eumeta japonica]|uniref:Uncharacterized protein n=1 Tax=Eumeta variegata TaxID=151549 RepID=A0A4C1ZBV4_EUMVA|nr:hypothetical protein EVAR_55687_1 [Eumeta japonica]
MAVVRNPNYIGALRTSSKAARRHKECQLREKSFEPFRVTRRSNVIGDDYAPRRGKEATAESSGFVRFRDREKRSEASSYLRIDGKSKSL